MTIRTEPWLANPDLDDALKDARAGYCERTPGSRELFERACRVMPGGNTRSVLYHGPYPFRVASGEGATIVDVDGHELVNLLGEYTAGIFGHSEPRIRAGIVAALENGINFGAHNSLEPQFAELVCARFPAIEQVRFTNSGTEANLMAITTARAATGRNKIMVFAGGYHGGVLLFKPGVTTNAPFEFVVNAFNDSAAAGAAIHAHADDLAAVLVEPMQGSAGCIPANGEFLATLRTATEATGSLLIFDEVMTSRLGPRGAQGIHGIHPDLTTLGKWIGGGMSFGAFGGRAELMELFDPRRADAIAHAGTFQNNVVTMAAGIVALRDVYTAEAALELTARGEGLRDRLNDIAAEIGVRVSASGVGSLINLHPVPGPIRSIADLSGADERLRELLFLDLLEAGYYIAPRGFIALSLAIGDAEIDGFTEAYGAILDDRRHHLR